MLREGGSSLRCQWCTGLEQGDEPKVSSLEAFDILPSFKQIRQEREAHNSVRPQCLLVKIDADNADLLQRRFGAEPCGVRPELLQQFCECSNLGTILEFPSPLGP
jgi:hypothetical protein